MVSCRGCHWHSRHYPRQTGPSATARPRYFVSAQDRPIFTATRSPQRRAGEGHREGGGHRLLQQDRGPRGIGFRHFQHDLVVRRRDRAAFDPRLEQSRVDRRQRQHEGVGAGALDRQIETLGVAVTFRIPVDLVNAPALAPDRDAAAALAGAREVLAPAREVGIGRLEGPDPRLRCGQVEDQAVLLPRRGDKTARPLVRRAGRNSLAWHAYDAACARPRACSTNCLDR